MPGPLSQDESLALAADFPPVTYEQWRAAVDRVLAGRDGDLSAEKSARRFARQLITTTYDGITIQPLYTKPADHSVDEAIGVPGSWPYVRGATSLGGTRGGWDVRQSVDLDRVVSSRNAMALEELEGGATSVFLRTDPLRTVRDVVVDVDLLDAALDGVHLDLVAVALDTNLGQAGAEALLALWQRRQVDPRSAAGTLGLDPIGSAASLGRSVDAEESREAVEISIACSRGWPNARALVVDATRYHEAGSSDVEEIACATATGVAYLRLLTDAGLATDGALSQLEFRLAASADQFSTIAKLRAARRMWARVAEHVGAPEAGAQRQHALTSRAMLSRYDAWVNLLRNTTACLAAGAGGAEAITVEPHDLMVDPGSPSELGRRMARNTQLLLLEETHLARVLDPGGGSWYVERLTDDMAERGWEWFREIEAAGGIVSALESRLVHERIDATWVERRNKLARRSDTLVGVSDFPDIEDSVPPPDVLDGFVQTPSGGLHKRRYAQDFEALRSRTDEQERRTGSRPVVVLVRLGPASAYTARATYAASFFETAGIRTVALDAEDLVDPDDLSAILRENGALIACLCSSDSVYDERGGAAAEVLAAAGLARAYAAARPGRHGEALLAAGADELIYAGCDVLDALQRSLQAVGVP